MSIKILSRHEQHLLLHSCTDAFVLAVAEKWTNAPPNINVRAHPYLTHPIATLLALHAGLRIGELTQLTWQNVIHGDQNAHWIEIYGRTSTKTHRRRIPTSRDLQTLLLALKLGLELRNHYDQHRPLLAKPGKPTNPTIRTVSRWIGAQTRRAIGRSVNPHMLRHTFATDLLRVATIRTVQDLLGHRTLAATEIYTHVTDDDLRAAIDARSKTATLQESLNAIGLAKSTGPSRRSISLARAYRPLAPQKPGRR